MYIKIKSYDIVLGNKKINIIKNHELEGKIMNEVILPRKRWQQIFNVQMIFALIVTILEMIPKRGHTAGNIFS